MKLKVNDLELLLNYLKKEAVQSVDLQTGKFEFGVVFEFQDLESRSCAVKIFEASTNTTPDITKTMKLYTRFAKAKEEKKDETN